MGVRGVLVMAYGSPDSLDDMEAYLNDIRGGRPMSPEFVAEFKSRYAQIGGKSPLNERTLEQAEALEDALKKRGYNVKAYVGMRHWEPRIKDAVSKMYQDGITEAVAIVMAPHYSSMSVARYWDKVKEAQEAVGSAIEFHYVKSWCRQPRLLDAQEAKARAGLAQFDEANKVKVVFSAHSLPARLKEMGDPYDDELQENARVLAQRLGCSDWMFSYQSAAKTGGPWLGPQIEDVIPKLASEGYRHVFVAPIGFVCDHVEVLYDIDVNVQNIAKEYGVQLRRIESMNDDPVFLEGVADAVVTEMGAP